eukprot:4830021-Pyramimonas_sp.AAC.1
MHPFSRQSATRCTYAILFKFVTSTSAPPGRNSRLITCMALRQWHGRSLRRYTDATPPLHPRVIAPGLSRARSAALRPRHSRST